MFNSDVKIKDIIDEIKGEMDIHQTISDTEYLRWFNALEQMLYSEVIKEQEKATLSDVQASPLALSAFTIANTLASLRFEDIISVYVDGEQLTKASVDTALQLGGVFYKATVTGADAIGFKTKDGDTSSASGVTIVFNVRPLLKTAIDTSVVMLPFEFLDIVYAKIRGEAYKIANVDQVSAKWMNDYNVLVDTFKSWITKKQATFGG